MEHQELCSFYSGYDKNVSSKILEKVYPLFCLFEGSSNTGNDHLGLYTFNHSEPKVDTPMLADIEKEINADSVPMHAVVWVPI